MAIPLVALKFTCWCQSLSRVRFLATPRTAARQASLSITISRSLLRLMSIKSVMPSNHLILCHPLLLLPPIPPSIRVFSNELALCIRWPAKVLELQLQHQAFHWIFSTDFLEDWLVWSPCSPRDSQESSPAPWFGSINSLVLSFLYGPTLISGPILFFNCIQKTAHAQNNSNHRQAAQITIFICW